MYEHIDKVRNILKSLSKSSMKSQFPILDDLLTRHYHAKAEVDIERALFMTRYYKDRTNSKKPEALKRAESIHRYLSNRKICFHDNNFLGGACTSKELGAPLYPEYFGITIWPELHTISTRTDNPQILSEKDADILNKEIFPYWMDRTINERVRPIEPERQALFDKFIFYILSKAGTISHTTPYYELVLKKGVREIIEEAKKREAAEEDSKKKIFYKTMQVAMEGVLQYARNIVREAKIAAAGETDTDKKENLLAIAEVLSNVPENPPRNFREALNAVWISQVAVLAENSNMAMSPGRLDQILYPYFIKDYNGGTLTIEDAIRYCGSFWLKMADNVNLVPETAERMFGGAGAVPAITLGGVDWNGDDAVNELTYILLKVTELLPIRDPNVNARYYSGVNTKDYRDEVSRVILSTKAIPAFFNDIENIKTMQNQNISLEDARDYSVIGCVELGASGKQYSASSSVFMMLHTVLYMALHEGRSPATGNKTIGVKTKALKDMKSYKSVWDAYKAQLEWLVDNAVHLNNSYGRKHQEYLATPLLSCFFDGTMESGKDLIDGGAIYNSSGVTHIGFADVADSLAAIKDICFNKDNDDISLKLEDFIAIVDADFNGEDKIYNYVKNIAPKYGRDISANSIAGKMVEINYDLYNSRQNYRGGNYQLAYWTMTNHAGYGRISPATPNGRKAKEVFSSGITPVSQVNTDVTTAYKSVAQLPSNKISNAYALNMKYTPISVNPESIKKFSALIEGFMKSGGQQVQYNIQDYKTLKDAKENPDKYPDLLVRVSGYSAYFKSLNEAMKDEIILRSQYNMGTGEFVSIEQE
ncbi:MAG: hypothetical protein KAQ69_08275 [Spirochaetales bacterium]|nr:hypothetical protein [Spirochaetales bacterium]